MALDAPVQTRLARAQESLPAAGVDLLLCAPSADLAYLIGYPAHPSERPTLLGVPADADPFIVVPQLEAPRLSGLSGVRVIVYEETESAYELVRNALGQMEPKRVAISDQAWASVLIELQAALPGARFRSAGHLLRHLRMRKSEDEVALMRRAGALVDEAFAIVTTRPFAGRTERDIAKELNEILTSLGEGVSSWTPIVASGPNSSSPHHMTGDRRLEPGDTVILDYGWQVDGYQADTTRTVHLGPPDTEARRVYDVVRQAQEAAVASVRPGTTAASVDQIARDVIDAAGDGEFFIHRTGHGIGLDTHEEPYIVQGNELVLEPGMTFSVEPGVYLPGRFGVRIEDIVAVTEDGAERLNNATRELVIVE
jgi:Xaa-Pro aminopeptidase